MLEKHEDLLMDTPDYENYTENEVVLSRDEMQKMGLFNIDVGCGGCKRSINSCKVEKKGCKGRRCSNCNCKKKVL